MARFIALKIAQKRKESLEAGKERYRAYFVKTALYKNFQNAVNQILIEFGLGDCIVTN
jgi:hypothetical protein